MKITEDVRKFAAEQGISDEAAFKKGMEERRREFTAKESDVFREDLIFRSSCSRHELEKKIEENCLTTVF